MIPEGRPEPSDDDDDDDGQPWHPREELRDLGEPEANPVIQSARISQKQPNIFSPTSQQDLLATKCRRMCAELSSHHVGPDNHSWKHM